MTIDTSSLAEVQSLLRGAYTGTTPEDLLGSIPSRICRLCGGLYWAVFLIPNSFISRPFAASNNPDGFMDVYASVVGGDYLLQDAVERGRPIVLSRYRNLPELGRREFSRAVQEARPISDIAYFPLPVHGRLAGVLALGRMVLRRPHFDRNEIELGSFLSVALAGGLERAVSCAAPADAQASVDAYGEVLAAGPCAQEALERAFGQDFWRRPFDSPAPAARDLKRSWDSFFSRSLPWTEPGLDLADLPYRVEFSYLPYPELRLHAPREPQALWTFLPRPGPDAAAPFACYDLEERFGLSPRELSVLDGVSRGWTNAVIGRELGIEESTVKHHLWSIFNKMGVNSRTQLLLSLR